MLVDVVGVPTAGEGARASAPVGDGVAAVECAA